MKLYQSIGAAVLTAYAAIASGCSSAQKTEEQQRETEAQGLDDVLVYGNRIKNGYQTRENQAGSTDPATRKFWFATVSTGVQIGGIALFLLKPTSGGGGSGGSAPESTPPAQGGDGFGPGTGPGGN